MAMHNSKNHSTAKYDFSSLKRETGFAINSNGYIQYVEAKIFDLLGYTDQELTGLNFKNFLYDSSILNDLAHLVYTTRNLNLILKHKDGHPVNAYVNLDYTHNLDMKIVTVYGTLFEMQRSNNIDVEFDTISRIVDNSKDVLYRYSVLEKKIIYLSKSVFQHLGYMAEEIINNKRLFFKSIHPDDLSKYRKNHRIQIDYSKPIVTRMRHRDGHYIWMEDCTTPVYSDVGNLLYLDGACRDISDKIENDSRLKYLTYHDALSGLYNRNYYEEKFKTLDKDLDVSVAIILCDLDNLKIVNDTLGHDKGDQMINHVGKILISLIDINSFAARIGGDEFVIVIKNTSLFNLKQIVNNLVDVIEAYNKRLEEYTINMSIGSAYGDHSLNNMQKLFKLADNQMYHNKSVRKAL